MSVEVARSGRSSCKKCREAIGLAKLRVGTNIGGDNFTGTAWFHVACWTPQAKLVSLDELDGWDGLTREQQLLLVARAPGCAQVAPLATVAAPPAAAGTANVLANNLSSSRNTCVGSNIQSSCGFEYTISMRCFDGFCEYTIVTRCFDGLCDSAPQIPFPRQLCSAG